MPLLVHTGYPGLEVEPSELVAILGAPGSGKTRLALELAFLARPRVGEVLFEGRNPMAQRHRFEMPQRPREVTLLVQNAEDQLFARSVFDDVAFGPRHLTYDADAIERRVVSALLAVRLDPDAIRDRSPFALSGGERRRVALAGVLAMEPQVLILDEPTANLDPRTRSEFLNLLAPLRGRTAIIWLTDVAREAALTDRVLFLRNGGLEEMASGETLYGHWQELLQAGVELPPVYQLVEELEQRGLELPDASTPDEAYQGIVEGWKEMRDAR